MRERRDEGDRRHAERGGEDVALAAARGGDRGQQVGGAEIEEEARFLAREGLVTPERIELLLSWRHSGFSVHNSVTVAPHDGGGLERLGRYLLRAPVGLERLAFDAATDLGSCRCRPGHEPFTGEIAGRDAAELLARVRIHIPEPRRHLVRSNGASSIVVRARRRAESQPRPRDGGEVLPPTSPERRALRRLWAALIRRIDEVAPLVCPRCGGTMRTMVVTTEPRVIGTILERLVATGVAARSPPGADPPSPPGRVTAA